MFCPKCGMQVSDEARFCPGCGHVIARGSQGQQLQQDSPSGDRKSGGEKPFPTAPWAVIVIGFLVIAISFLITQFPSSIEGKTWYQENNYYGYSATLVIEQGSYRISVDGATEYTGSAEVDGKTCVFDGEYEYSLSSDGRTLTCTNNRGTNVLAGEWFSTRDDAAKFPRRQ